MNALILDGSLADDMTGKRTLSALQAVLASHGWTSETVLLREKKIANCAGDFLCWLKSPGMCTTNDDNREIAKKIMQSDLVINLTRITFGGYSATIKRMIDHQIQNILPFFMTINGETHHQKRYDDYPNILTVGWLSAPDPDQEAVFRHLVYRNSLNMYPESCVCGVLCENQPDNELANSLNLWLTRIERKESDPVPVLPKREASAGVQMPVRRALLLVGSPRMQKSSSASLGNYLFEQLAQRGIETETVHLYRSIHSPEGMKTLFASLDAADLVVLAFPLYVDSLPAPVIDVLEKIALHRAPAPVKAHFAAIANCGFPEACHNDNALAVCEAFARSAGFGWMGGLSLGGGEMIHGVALKEFGGRGIPMMKSLDMAAEALAAGNAMPENARKTLAKLSIPNWLYKVAGTFGWKQQAKKYGTRRSLTDHPYQKAS